MAERLGPDVQAVFGQLLAGEGGAEVGIMLAVGGEDGLSELGIGLMVGRFAAESASRRQTRRLPDRRAELEYSTEVALSCRARLLSIVHPHQEQQWPEVAHGQPEATQNEERERLGSGAGNRLVQRFLTGFGDREDSGSGYGVGVCQRFHPFFHSKCPGAVSSMPLSRGRQLRLETELLRGMASLPLALGTPHGSPVSSG